MWRANIKNRAFDRMGEYYAPLIDPYHFLGRSAFDVPRPKGKKIPPVNILQKGELFVLELAVPGFAKDELEIVVNDEVLTVRGEKAAAAKSDSDAEFILEEFDFETFERKFRLAPSIAREKISASYDHGILRLTFIDVPKEEERDYQTVKVQ